MSLADHVEEYNRAYMGQAAIGKAPSPLSEAVDTSSST